MESNRRHKAIAWGISVVIHLLLFAVVALTGLFAKLSSDPDKVLDVTLYELEMWSLRLAMLWPSPWRRRYWISPLPWYARSKRRPQRKRRTRRLPGRKAAVGRRVRNPARLAAEWQGKKREAKKGLG